MLSAAGRSGGEPGRKLACNPVTLLLDELSVAVDQIQYSGACCSACPCESHGLTLDNSDVRQLVAAVHKILCFALLFPIRSYWPLLQDFVLKSVLNDVLKKWRPKPGSSSCLVWLYEAMNDSALLCYFESFAANSCQLRKHYSTKSVFFDPSAVATITQLLARIEPLKFNLQPASSVNSILGPEGCICSRSNSQHSFDDCPSEAGKQAKDVRRPGDAGDANNSLPAEPTVVDMVHCPHLSGVDRMAEGFVERIDLAEEALDLPETTPARVGLPSARPALGLSSDRTAIVEFHAAASGVTETQAKNSDSPVAAGGRRRVKKRRPTILAVIDDEGVIEDETLSDDSASVRALTASGRRLGERFFTESAVSHSVRSANYLDGMAGRDQRRGSGKEDQQMSMSFTGVVDTSLWQRESPEGQSNDPEDCDEDEISVSDKIALESVSQMVADVVPCTSPSLAEEMKECGKKRSVSLIEETEVLFRRVMTMQGAESNPTTDENAMRDPSVKFLLGETHTNVTLRSSPSKDANGNVINDFPRRQTMPSLTELDYNSQLMSQMQALKTRTGSRDLEGSLSLNSHSRACMAQEEACIEEVSVVDSDISALSSEVSIATIGGHDKPLEIKSSAAINILLNVFDCDGEELYKAFMVYTGHNMGTAKIRFFVISNAALYLVRRRSEEGKNGPDFERVWRLNFADVEVISLLLNSQAFTLICRDNTMHLVCTGDELLTRNILSNVEVAMRRAGVAELPAAVSSGSSQKACIQKWASAELRLDEQLTVPQLYTLVYWRNLSHGDVRFEASTRSGYLHHRRFVPGTWRWSAPQWQTSYFLLRGKKLYQFADSTCKIGEHIYNMKSDVMGCRRVSTRHERHCLDVILQRRDECLQLACPSAHDLTQWLNAIVFALSAPDETSTDCVAEALACCAVLTPDHVLLCQEQTRIDFVRTLATADFNDVTAVVAVESENVLIMVVNAESEFGGQWMLSFSSSTEYRKFVDKLAYLWYALTENELDVQKTPEQQMFVDAAAGMCHLWSPVQELLAVVDTSSSSS